MSCDDSSNSSDDASDDFWGDLISDDDDDDDEILHKPSEWTEIKDAPTRISYDEARHNAWELGKTEIYGVRSSILQSLQLEHYSDFKMQLLVDYIIDRLWPIVNRNLNNGIIYSFSNPLTKEKFQRIIAAFLILSSFRISTTSFYDEDMISKEGICSCEDYKFFWNAISEKDGGDYDNTKMYLWQQISNEVNSICRDLFLNNWSPHCKKHVTIDDDKCHFNGKKGAYQTCGLRPAQFVRDNRKGFVFHTLVFTCSGIPLGIEAELVSDSGSTDAASRVLTQQLAPAYNHVTGKVPDLTNLVLYADRLYWTKAFMDDFILPSGADIGPSTHKREHSFPFTFDQKLTRNDTRELIPKIGGKCILLKERKKGPHKLLAIAYRDGTGNVPLGISSGACRIREKQWDFHFNNPRDRYKLLKEDSGWHTSPNTWIKPLKPNLALSTTFVSALTTTTNVKAMTTGGSRDKAWFIARGFSFTSSTVDKVIHAVHEFVKSDGSISVSDIVLVTTLNRILSYIGKTPIVLPSLQDEEVISEVAIQQDVYVDGVNISDEIRVLRQNESESTELFLSKIAHSSRFSDNCLSSMIVILGGKPLKTRKTNEKNIKDWINASPIEKREYVLLQRSDLVEKCKAKLKGGKSAYDGKKKEILIEQLLESDLPTNDRDSIQASKMNGLSDTLTSLIISGAFMKPITGQNKQATRIGLDNEERLLSKLYEESSNRKVLCPNEGNIDKVIHVHEINIPGMVRKVVQEYVKSSIDALGLIEKTSSVPSTTSSSMLIGIEIKTRTTQTTRQPEVELRNTIQHKRKFVKIPFSQAKKYIPNNHECIQILHHAFVYDLEQVLLLIGDWKSIILRGVWVVFDDEIKSAFKDFLTRCYEYSLDWAYNGNDTLENMEHLLPKNIDVSSFRDYFMLCKLVNTRADRLPIPRTIYVKPLHFTIWCSVKGGSDTLTNLFWNCKHYVPSNTAATNVLSHLLRFVAALMFRCDAVMQCDENLDKYETLLSWRKSNQTRLGSFELFIRKIAKQYLCKADKRKKLPEPITIVPILESESDSPNVITPVYDIGLSQQTFNTPQRKIATQYDHMEADDDVYNRRMTCTGRIIYRVSVDEQGISKEKGPGGQKYCAHCRKRRTKFYCLGCRHWLCITPNDSKSNASINYVAEEDGQRVYFKHSCWNKWHEPGTRFCDSIEPLH